VSDRPDVHAATLIARFRRQRPLRGGSLLVTMFGDGIATRGGAITLGSLIQLAAPFGLNERLVRTAVGRLAIDGWLQAVRQGRISEYSLSASGRARFAAATERIYGAMPRVWDGRWTIIVPADAKAPAIQQLRNALRWEGFGELGRGVFIHPTRTVESAMALLTALVGEAAPFVVRSEPQARAQDLRVVRLGWNLSSIESSYQSFTRLFDPVARALRRATAISPITAYSIRTLLIHEFRKVNLRDPQLPSELLPDTWSGTLAYALCRDVYASVLDPSERHLSAVGACFAGRLPRADAQLLRRFGGLRSST
jgi:phenylacetic acid degradation operon negative regulatory protein